jgi:alkanesulfonate monooxygenase SsuD/methylene tetrahydromethanopterin reductase-like flavin-dependent oxidoreductase (luciferase family)
METGLFLPLTIPGTKPETVLEWARRAEARGFSSVAAIDRLVYGNYEPLIGLTAAAAVTRRVRLVTGILIAPLRNTALLAKELATLDRLSTGRLVVGLGLGGRTDDFTGAGLGAERRGRQLSAQIQEMRRIWSGEKRGMAGAIGPAPAGPQGPPLIVGGASDAALKRAARYGDGWIGGGGGVDAFRASVTRVRELWREAGRAGQPRFLSLAYYALGPNARTYAETFLRDYYAFAGPMVERMINGAALDESAIRQRLSGYGDAGCDELLFVPCSAAIDQLERLADVVG